MKSLRTALFVFIIGVGLSSSANAASFYGKVVEVRDGDSITIFNLNRKVQVKLLGVDAPEMKQAFFDVSRQHLSDLILDKFVTVEYSGISSGAIVGKVTLADADICAQMIRDGAAWFDGKQTHVGELDSQVYQQSELAARQERRGLWAEESPIAPWEFARAEIERRKPVVAVAKVNPESAPKKTATGELSTESLRFSTLPAKKLRDPRTDTASEMIWSGSSEDNWKTMRPSGEMMSVYVPANGRGGPVDQREDSQMDYNAYVAHDGDTIYQVYWITGPASGESDDEFVQTFFAKYLRSLSGGLEKSSGPGTFSCWPSKSTALTQGGFTGREFDLRECPIPGVARMFTKVEGDKRRVYFTLGMYRANAPSNDAYTFVRSLKVGTSAGPLQAKKN